MEVAADAGQVEAGCHAEGGQLVGRSDTAAQQYFGAAVRAAAQDEAVRLHDEPLLPAPHVRAADQ